MNGIFRNLNINYNTIFLDNDLHYPLLHPMLCSNISSQIYMNKYSSAYFILGNNGWCYQLGNKNDTDFNKYVLELIENEMLNRKEILWFGCPDIDFHSYNFELKRSKRIEFEYLGMKKLELSKTASFDIHRATENELRELYFLHDDISTYWETIDNFVGNGFSYIAKNADKIIGYVLSASICESVVEVDVWTNPEYRGQGISKLLCSHFIGYCHDNSLLPKWDCFEDNIASIKLAKTLGFVEKRKYYFGYIYKN